MKHLGGGLAPTCFLSLTALPGAFPVARFRPKSCRSRLFNFFVLIINIGNNWFLGQTRPFVAMFNLVCGNHVK